jgi:hypothetical protein
MDAKDLLQWAETQQRVFPLKEDYDFAGAEHQVWYQGDGRVFKAAVSPKTIGFGPDGQLTLVEEKSIEAYLDRKQIHNALFHEDFRLEGVCLSEDDRVIPLVSQPILEGDNPDLEEIETYFKAKGMKCVLPHIKGWYSEELDILVADAHPRNLVRTRTGVSVFDLVITRSKNVTKFIREFAIQRELQDSNEDEL